MVCDLLLFPIDPSSILPRIEGLSSLWSLYTVKIHEGNLPVDADLNLENDRLIRLTLTINTSFSKSVIDDDLRRFVRSRITKEPTIREKPRWSDEQFESYLKVIDTVYPNGKRIKVTHRRVGERCAPKAVLNKVNSDRAVIDWAKDTLKYVEKKLMPLFNKSEAVISKRRAGY
jgi:hypothetical protein